MLRLRLVYLSVMTEIPVPFQIENFRVRISAHARWPALPLMCALLYPQHSMNAARQILTHEWPGQDLPAGTERTIGDARIFGVSGDEQHFQPGRVTRPASSRW